jgi:hypothetical protein
MNAWQKKIEFDMEFAEKTLVECGEVRPMAVLTDKDDALHIVALDLSTDEMKQKSFRYLRLLAVAHEAKSLSMLGEMWMRALQPYPGESHEAFTKRALSLRARDAEDRTEVVMVQSYYRDDAGDLQEVSQTREIIRGDDGKPTGLAPPPDEQVLESQGPMTELMPRRPPHPEKVRFAKEMLERIGYARPIH